jgi:hypothetical protein
MRSLILQGASRLLRCPRLPAALREANGIRPAEPSARCHPPRLSERSLPRGSHAGCNGLSHRGSRRDGDAVVEAAGPPLLSVARPLLQVLEPGVAAFDSSEGAWCCLAAPDGAVVAPDQQSGHQQRRECQQSHSCHRTHRLWSHSFLSTISISIPHINRRRIAHLGGSAPGRVTRPQTPDGHDPAQEQVGVSVT